MADNKKKGLGLTTWIFIALLAGAVVGIIFHYFVPASYVRDTVIVGGIFQFCGQGFIRLMQMLVVPLVFCSLICGASAIGDSKTLGKVGAKIIVMYIFTTAVAITVAILISRFINPGIGLDVSSLAKADDVQAIEKTSMIDTLLNIIPKNPLNGLANGEMLQVILFALIIGVIIAKLGERVETVANFFA